MDSVVVLHLKVDFLLSIELFIKFLVFLFEGE